MEGIPETNYAKLSEVYERISQREKDAAKLPHGEPRQAILTEIAQLRWYAELRLCAGLPPASIRMQ